MSFQESNQFKRKEPYGISEVNKTFDVDIFLPHVLSKLPANEPQTIINGIDAFCLQNWMMNLGDDKGKIVKEAINKYKPKNILELGTYCGYSSLLMAFTSKAKVHTFDPDEKAIAISKKLHEHAGLQDLITCHQGTIQSESNFMKEHGPFDMIFIDHWKDLYLPDLKWLEENKIIAKGTVVIGDNIISPGVPDYLQYFKENKDYKSILYHANQQYFDNPDAVLVSERIL